MASQSTTVSPVSVSSTTTSRGISVADLVRAILSPLASLKLTVVLLVLGVIVTFIATVDQTRHDILDVKHKHFENVMVEVPFQTFFVPRWFPDHQNVPGSFYIPSGISILVLMLVNLTAAHCLRFRLQATGTRLIAGVVTAILAGALTWIIIFNGQNPDGFQAQPPIPYESMWVVLQIAVLALGCAAGFGFFTLEKERKIERILLLVSALTMLGVLAVSIVLGDKAFIGAPAMRILWQLAQATVAALAGLAACMLLFKRKAGIVLLHLGVGGLMLNEIYVYATNQEQRMTILEGETVSEAIDIRSTELAIIDTSDSEVDQFVVVPDSKLKIGQRISDERLPFDIEVVEFFANSDVRPIRDPKNNLATKGLGTRFEALFEPPTTGTSTDQKVDFASAYVTLFEKGSGDTLGTYLVSQLFDVNRLDTVAVEGKPYQIQLRFKTDYKPFSLYLEDVEAKNYLGTQTAKSYSSRVILDDFDSGTKSKHKIWMNNPLRYSNQTFYQSSLGTSPATGNEYTVLQVVTNRGWMIPYVCCMFTVVGLIAQFGSSLLKFLEKRRQQIELIPAAELAIDPTVGESGPTFVERWKSWIPTAVLVGFFGLYVVGEVYKATSQQVENDEEMRLDLLGRVPVTHNGRVQPLDSFARSTVRQLSKRESVQDGNGDSQPAIRWLADTMFEADGYDEYCVFRIEDPRILSTLDLPLEFKSERRNKNRFRYTYAELFEALPTVRELLPDPEEKDPEQWTPFQKRLSEVYQKFEKGFGAKLAFGSRGVEGDDLLLKLQDAGATPSSSPLLPLVVPQDDPEKPWKSFVRLQNQALLAELAKEFDAETTEALAAAVLDKEIWPTLRKDMIRTRVVQRMLSDATLLGLLEKRYGETDKKIIAEKVLADFDQFPPETIATIQETEGQMADAILNQRRPAMERMLAMQIAKVNGDSGEIETEISETGSLLLKLRPAYQTGDAQLFNSTLKEYLTAVNANPPEGMKPHRVSLEGFYNLFSPFYLAMVIYLVAALVGIFSWVGWSVSLNRASFWLLMLGLAIQISGLVMRVVISGRPPVTNLYSSALFVSAVFIVAMMIAERITRLGIGSVMAGVGGFLALLWAWTMSIVDGDTFAVLVAVLDTQFWLSTHVVTIAIGYSATLAAGFLGLAYIFAGLITPSLKEKEVRRVLANVIYGVVCFGLLTSFFGTVLGGLWADDSWGRFWGWDPKENGALMIVLWNAVVLHARWGGLVRERGLAALAVVGNVITLWSWKGVNSMGVGLHAYAGTEDTTVKLIMLLAMLHLLVAAVAAIVPTKFWMSYQKR